MRWLRWWWDGGAVVAITAGLAAFRGWVVGWHPSPQADALWLPTGAYAAWYLVTAAVCLAAFLVMVEPDRRAGVVSLTAAGLAMAVAVGFSLDVIMTNVATIGWWQAINPVSCALGYAALLVYAWPRRHRC